MPGFYFTGLNWPDLLLTPPKSLSISGNKVSSIVLENRAREHLNWLYIGLPVEPEGVCSSMLRDLGDALARLLSITFEKSW